MKRSRCLSFCSSVNRIFCLFRGQIALFCHSLKVLTVVLIVLSGARTFAKEGFSSEVQNAPAAVKTAWDATFLVIYSKDTHFHTGSAFLIQTKMVENELVLVFLTVAHNIGNCETDGKICPHLMLIQNARVTETPTMMKYDTLEGLRFDTVAARRIKGFADIAIVVASMSLRDPRQPPTPLTLTDNCDIVPGAPLFAVGYPDTRMRTNPKSLPINHAEETLKRWSEGLYIGEVTYPRGSEPFFATTLDGLVGLSGGPILDQDGHVVSLVRKGATLDGNEYSGSEDPSHLDWHTLGSTCLQLKKLGANLGD